MNERHERGAGPAWTRLLTPWTSPLAPGDLFATFRPAFAQRRRPDVDAWRSTGDPGPRRSASSDLDAATEASPGLAGRAPSDGTDPGSTAEGTITWGDATVVAEPGETILAALERSGHRPKVGCRRGTCRRCVVPLEAGCVVDQRDARTVEAGTHVRICVGRPLGPVTLATNESPAPTASARPEVTNATTDDAAHLSTLTSIGARS